MTSPPHVLVVGYLSIDTIVTTQACWDEMPGGAALYAALGACWAGARVTMVAAVGEDFPAAWLEALAEHGIDVTAVERRGGGTRRAHLVHGPADARASPHHRDAAWHERTAALLPALPGGLDGFDAVVAAPTPAALLSQIVRAAPCPVIADTSEVFAATEREAMLALLPDLYAFAPSVTETRLLLPGLDDDAAAQALAESGPLVLQKRGSAGAMAVGRGECVTLPARPVRVVDPTGAGDATVGALAALLTRGQAFVAAAALALEAGSVTVSAPGAAALGFAP